MMQNTASNLLTTTTFFPDYLMTTKNITAFNLLNITTTQLLAFLAKAHKVSSDVDVTKEDEGYKITVYADWYSDDHFFHQSTFITDEGKYKYKFGYEYEEFFTMNGELDHLVREEEEREIKRQKRQELLSRLTDEEKELLGVE